MKKVGNGMEWSKIKMNKILMEICKDWSVNFQKNSLLVDTNLSLHQKCLFQTIEALHNFMIPEHTGKFTIMKHKKFEMTMFQYVIDKFKPKPAVLKNI